MLGAEIVLLLALAQQPRTVALVIDGRVQIVALVDAERLYEAIGSKSLADWTDEDRKLHAALTVALGTLRQDVSTCPSTHQPLCETIRGRRLPLQRSER